MPALSRCGLLWRSMRRKDGIRAKLLPEICASKRAVERSARHGMRAEENEVRTTIHNELRGCGRLVAVRTKP